MNTSRLLTVALALLLVAGGMGFWVAAAPGFAAEAQTEAGANEDDPDSEAGDGGPSEEVFIPTEEISEDFAVSFPVDI